MPPRCKACPPVWVNQSIYHSSLKHRESRYLFKPLLSPWNRRSNKRSYLPTSTCDLPTWDETSTDSSCHHAGESNHVDVGITSHGGDSVGLLVRCVLYLDNLLLSGSLGIHGCQVLNWNTETLTIRIWVTEQITCTQHLQTQGPESYCNLTGGSRMLVARSRIGNVL
jgi:hypothetical protein